MQRIELAEFVASTIASVCQTDIAKIGPETDLLDLRMDSLSLIAVISQIEAAYEIQFSADDILPLIELTRFADFLNAADALISRYCGN